MLGAYPFALLDPHTAYGIWRLRQEVFVLEQECLYPDLDDRDTEPGTRHVVLQDEHNLVVGCARVLEDHDRDTGVPLWRIGRVALARSARGQGWSGRLMDAALQVCVGRAVVLDAQAPLRGWYESFGFVVTGPEFLDDGIPHLPMRRPGQSARPPSGPSGRSGPSDRSGSSDRSGPSGRA